MRIRKFLNILSSSLLGTLLLFSCRKDKVPEPVPDPGIGGGTVTCENFTYSDGVILPFEVSTGLQYTEPCFSPFSDDEFIYVRNVDGVNPELVRYNIQTATEQVLCTSAETDNYPLAHPDWGAQGKVIFNVGTGVSGIGYMIDDNGNNLHQFLPPNVDFKFPKFNGTGDEVIATGNAHLNGYHPTFDLAANIVDSFPWKFNANTLFVGLPGAFEGDFITGLFSYFDHSINKSGFGYIESSTTFNSILTTTDPVANPSGYLVTDMGKYQNLVYYVVYGLGFYEFNENTGQTRLLQEMCDSRKIINISVSQFSGNILIEEMANTKASESGGVDIQSNIWLFNPSTGEKTPILVE